MTKLFFAILLLLTANAIGQTYYSINPSKTPENPIPVKFTVNNFGLNGKVKLMVTRHPESNEITAFDEKGLCKGIKSITTFDTTETVFFYGLPVNFVIKQTSKYRNKIIAYSLKYENTIVESIPADDKGQPLEISKMLYTYNNRGLFEGISAAGESNPELQYQYFYNDEKQIIKKREYQYFKIMSSERKKEYSTTVYEYKKDGTELRVTITETNTESKVVNKTINRVYNQAGLLTYENKIEFTIPSISSISYIMDAHNNWISKTVTNMNEGSPDKGKQSVTTRMIQYY